MLVLNRTDGERIRIGDDIWVTLIASEGGRTTFGIEAPADVRIIRAELEGTPPKPHYARRMRRKARQKARHQAAPGQPLDGRKCA